ncbi:MAG: hypothetical protein OWU32_03550 [Firmicutes bacterium]|nr:hypothetical protein [Bacillota bacterium]
MNIVPEVASEHNTLMRSFVSEVVHQRFFRAVRRIGLPDFPWQTFLVEVSHSFHTVHGRLPDDRQSLRKLWRSMRDGEIFATEVWDNSPVFYVRATLESLGVVLRLIYMENEWHVESVISIYHNPLTKVPWFRRSVLAAVVVVSLGLGFALRPVPQPAVAGTAGTQTTGSGRTQTGTGSADTKGADKAGHAHAPGSAVTGTKGAHHAKTGANGPAAASASGPQAGTLTFTLAEGAPLYNLALFLYQNHLVANPMTFDMLMKQTGIDLDVQPGTYRFRSGMTTAAILAELKRGPAA